MAENEEAEQPGPGDENTIDAMDQKNDTAKKVTRKKATKKRVAKKKVVKKSAATKKILTKKTAAKASGASNEVEQDSSRGVAEEGIGEEKAEERDSINAGEPSDAADRKSGIRDDVPAATGSSELPREEKVTMSAEASNTAKSSPVAGFGPKVILWIVVVLAVFMYIRSQAHKGGTVKISESTAPVAVSPARVETETATMDEKAPPVSHTETTQGANNEPSTVAKVGEVAVDKAVTVSPSSETESPAAVSGAPSEAVGQEKGHTVDAGVPLVSVQSGAEQKEVKPGVASEPAATPSVDAGTEPGAETAGTSVVAADAGAGSAGVGDAAVSQSGVEESGTEAAAVGEPESPSTAVGESPAASGGISEPATLSGTSSEEAAVSAPGTAGQGSEAASAADNAADSGQAAPERAGREFARRGTMRPSFRELFGYERPKPMMRRQDNGNYEPFSNDSYEQQGYYPAPWQQYAPRPPAWGGEYPGQYGGPYGGGYGNYSGYPNMPDWAPYQPYRYGPSNY
ncbi:MAG: hypothetical protein KDI74_15095 [Gammaproteobacteria bacterium]|nr:hypothetical protein [Gammaproteobacteria bacterium]